MEGMGRKDHEAFHFIYHICPIYPGDDTSEGKEIRRFPTM
jgi:hypothetical protein